MDFIARFGATASKAPQCQDRRKKLEKLRAAMLPPPTGEIRALAATVEAETATLKAADRAAKGKGGSSAASAGAAFEDSAGGGGLFGSPTADGDGSNGAKRLSNRGPNLKFPSPPPCGETPVALRGAAFGWPPRGGSGDEATATVPVATGVDVELTAGMRMIVRGPNGAGKSTLVKALAGALPLLEGERVTDERLKLGHFTQDLSQELDQTATALELVVRTVDATLGGTLSDQDARAALGALGLKGGMALRLVGDLSGGEKARVALAIFALTPANVLILDEPSNHLDVDTVAALTDALAKYEGAIVVVSHDRAFCEALAPTHVATVQGGAVVVESRTLEPSDWVIE